MYMYGCSVCMDGWVVEEVCIMYLQALRATRAASRGLAVLGVFKVVPQYFPPKKCGSTRCHTDQPGLG